MVGLPLFSWDGIFHLGGVRCFLLVYFREVLIAMVQVFPGPWKVDMILHFSFRILALLCWPPFGLHGFILFIWAASDIFCFQILPPSLLICHCQWF
jgi:hypothetical protein